MKTYHVIAVHRDRNGRILSVRFLEDGCHCLNRTELLRCLNGPQSVRITFLHEGRWRDGGKVRCANGALLARDECGKRDGLSVLPDY